MATINLAKHYNASMTFLDANIEAGRGDKIAIITSERSWTYSQIAALSNQVGNALKRLDVRMGERVLLVLPDSSEFAASFFGAIRIGAIPIPTSTFFSSSEYEYLLNDSRAVALVVSDLLYAKFEPIRANLKFLKHVIVLGNHHNDAINFDDWIHNESVELVPADTNKDDVCFWLYSSGTTGFPKGVIHLQHDMVYCAEHYARRILGITEEDRIFSVPRLFFAYGLGNALYFPFYAGATTILLSNPPSPQAVYETIRNYRPSIFFSVPTNYAALLNISDPEKKYSMESVRFCVSAGEALPKTIFEHWYQKWGVEILDGIGTTEILHIFISNRPGRVMPGSTGELVPSYDAKIVDDSNQPLSYNQIGNLLIKGDSICSSYWNNHLATTRTIIGEWIRTGDKYLMDEKGYFWYQGRSDDMLKVAGIWVSPVEVEMCLISNPIVLECAVVGKKDAEELIKPIAFIVLKQGYMESPKLAAELMMFCKKNLDSYKCPRWIEFTQQIPKSATGKIQRYKLRQLVMGETE